MDQHEEIRITMPDNYVYRDQGKRYPWWVKPVDSITTPVDDAIMEKPKGTVIQFLFKQPPEDILNLVVSGKEKYSERVPNDEPGTRLQDVALHQGAATFWWAAGFLYH